MQQPGAATDCSLGLQPQQQQQQQQQQAGVMPLQVPNMGLPASLAAALPASSSNTATHTGPPQQQQQGSSLARQNLVQHQQQLLQHLHQEQQHLQSLQTQQLAPDLAGLLGHNPAGAYDAAGSVNNGFGPAASATNYNTGSGLAVAPAAAAAGAAGVPAGVPIDGQMGSLVQHLGAVQSLLSQARSLLTSVHEVDPAAAAEMVRHIKATLKGTSGIESAFVASEYAPAAAQHSAAAVAGVGASYINPQQQQQQQQVFGMAAPAASSMQQQQQMATNGRVHFGLP
jgi:hypothetical protein